MNEPMAPEELVSRTALYDHLVEAHDLWLTTAQFYDLSLVELRKLDPCEVRHGV